MRLRKRHPCGSYEWQVVTVGADIGMRCLGCGRRVKVKRSLFERQIESLPSREQDLP